MLFRSAQSLKGVKVVVLYEAVHQHALDRLRQRFHIDAALSLPVNEVRFATALQALTTQA